MFSFNLLFFLLLISKSHRSIDIGSIGNRYFTLQIFQKKICGLGDCYKCHILFIQNIFQIGCTNLYNVLEA